MLGVNQVLLLFLSLLLMLNFSAAQHGVDLVVHIVPHSHVDAGWLETSDEYYTNSISEILTQVLNQLDHNVKRRFVWAETKHFRRWYESLSQLDKTRVLRVIQDGQFEFVGGGLVQPDEALPSLHAILEQYTVGHDWLYNNFGIRPTVGWQIDVTGHSDATPSILALMGFEALVINRVHFRVKQQFKSEKHMEFFWKGAEVGKDASPLLTHIMAEHYSTPEGYDFESAGVRQVTNAKRRSDRLVKAFRLRASFYKTHHLLVPFGDDLRFVAADKQFTNMEKLMRNINENVDGVEIRFSTASEYFTSVRQTLAVTSMKLPLYQGDFYPYADNAESYWSGVFSSRPLFKQSCRRLDSLVRSSNFLFVLARSRAAVLGDADAILKVEGGQVFPDHSINTPGWGAQLYKSMETARVVAAEMTHHHAITGAAKNRVIDDFVRQIDAATMSANKVVLASLEQLLTKRHTSNVDGLRVRPTLTTLPFIIDKGASSSGIQHPIVFHNWRATERVEMHHLTINSAFTEVRHIQVVDSEGQGVPAQVYQTLVPVTNRNAAEGDRRWRAQSVLSFLVRVPPFGFSTYFVSTTSARERLRSSGAPSASASITTVYEIDNGEVLRQGRQGAAKPDSRMRGGANNYQDDDVGLSIESSTPLSFMSIENDLIKVEVEVATGLIKAVEDKRVDRRTLLRQQFVQFYSPNSGVHLFRPEKSPEQVSLGPRLTLSFVNGPLVYEINVLGHSGLSQRIRLFKLDSSSQVNDVLIQGHAEISYVVSPETDSDLVLRYETSMNTGGKFYTDNVLGNLVLRQAHPDAPTASTFFPVSSCVALRDNQATSKSRMGQMLSIVTGQPLAASSPVQHLNRRRGGRDGNVGVLDLVLHRNHQNDDGRGINEGLDDYTTVQIDTYLAVDIPGALQARLPELTERLQYPLQPAFALENNHVDQILNRASWLSRFKGSESYVLPGVQSQLQIVSFYARDAVSDDIVFRFRNALPADESNSVQLDLHQFFVQSRHVYGLRPRTLDITAPQSLLAQLQLGDVSSESRGSRASPALEAGGDDFPDKLSNAQRQGMGKLNSGEDGVFLSDHAVRQRSPLGINVDGASVSIGPGQLKSFLMVMITLTDKDLPVPGRSRENPQRTQVTKSHSTHVNDATEVPHPEKAGSSPDPRGAAPTVSRPVRVSSHEGMEKEDLRKKIEKDKKMIAVLENRVKRFKALIDDLSQDLKLMGDDDESEDKLEMVQELSKTEDQLEQASEQLEQRKVELYASRQRLAKLEGKLSDSSLFDPEDREWEATLQGIVTGAGGMLVLVLGFNLIRARLSNMPSVAVHVPIRWVGFSAASEEQLPYTQQGKML